MQRSMARSELPPWLTQSAIATARAIEAGEVSSETVVASHLDRIAQINPALHAIVQLSSEALQQARDADRWLATNGPRGPLHGVPFTIKDWIETNDLICSAGFPERERFMAKRDATVVQRLRRAGGILLGKTKAGAEVDLYPVTLNPFDATHTAGASSAGEAVLIAASGSPIGLGSDSGGSLRWPAHCCGIATLKPTSGLVPLTGHFPPIIALSDPRTVIGPMARHVEDLECMLAIIAGVDHRDASVIPIRPGDSGAVTLAGLRVAWFSGFGDTACDEETKVALNNTVAALAAQGAEVTEDCPPLMASAMATTRAYWARPESTSLDQWRPWGKSRLSADDIESSIFNWDRLRRAMTVFMGRYDVIVCPVASTAAPKRLAVSMDDYAFTVPFSLTGQPVLVLRAGTSAAGLPIGVQIVAANFQDHVAIALGRRVESSLGKFSGPSKSLAAHGIEPLAD